MNPRASPNVTSYGNSRCKPSDALHTVHYAPYRVRVFAYRAYHLRGPKRLIQPMVGREDVTVYHRASPKCTSYGTSPCKPSDRSTPSYATVSGASVTNQGIIWGPETLDSTNGGEGKPYGVSRAGNNSFIHIRKGDVTLPIAPHRRLHRGGCGCHQSGVIWGGRNASIQPMVGREALRYPRASPSDVIRDLRCKPYDRSTSSTTPCRVQVSLIGHYRGARDAWFNQWWGRNPYGIIGPVPVSPFWTCTASLPIASYSGCRCRQSGIIGGPVTFDLTNGGEGSLTVSQVQSQCRRV